MKYTKPSGPYIAILAVLFITSLVSLPTGKTINNNTTNLGETISNSSYVSELSPIQNQDINIIKIEKHD